MGKMERGLRSLRWSMHKFAHNGRGLQHCYASQRSIENARWRDMQHQYPGKSLVYRLHEAQCGKRFDEALASLPAPVETAFDKRFIKRMTLSFHIFRLAASFFLTLVLGNIYAAVDNGTAFSIAMSRIALSQHMTANTQSKNHQATEVLFTDTIPDIGNRLKAALENTIHIDGNVKSAQTSANISGAKVVAIDTENNVRVDSTYTNSLGNYDMNFLWTVSNNHETLETKLNAYPNPYSGSTNIDVNCNNSENYSLKVFNLQGQVLFEEELALERGQNKITLNNGAQGIHLVVLENKDERKAYKTIQTSNSNLPFTANISTIPSYNNFKTTLDGITDGSEIRIEYRKEGYIDKDTTFTLRLDQTVNMTLEQIPYLFTTTFKPYLETGEPVTNLVPNFTTTVQWPDGTVNSYPVVNGQINIEKEIYKNSDGTLGNILINNDTTGVDGVLNWSIIRQPKQRTNRPNVAQNETIPNYPYWYTAEYQTSVSLDSLDNKTLHYYTIRKRAETQPGEYESLNSLFSEGLYGSSGGLANSMFIDLAPFGVADSLDLVRFGFNLDSNVPNTPEQQARNDDLFQQVINTRYLPNGDTLLPPHRIYTITSFSDPRWQEVVSRGYENMVYTTLHNGTPENSREWSSTYSYNGRLRLKNTSARYNISNGDGTMFTENFSAVTGEEEGSGGMGQFVWNETMGTVSQYGKSISTIPVLLNLGTGQQVKKSDSSNPKELYSLTVNGQAPVFFTDAKKFYESSSSLKLDYLDSSK